jgi:hypothetical protein
MKQIQLTASEKASGVPLTTLLGKCGERFNLTDAQELILSDLLR